MTASATSALAEAECVLSVSRSATCSADETPWPAGQRVLVLVVGVAARSLVGGCT